ncbi:hypothetical protein F5B22DRAFT_133418 [Xylaria bambusicola]|uniref:uncharacterized protein n=1 Tax=Xylaria bambusicola TaxID=326684 RepID=UPI002008897F|nr:uncharacterized protein F5B22DRAFT_133418 [Xylaria bambusicola]KAI0517199.1 hypothetical protein F5B22DRAFT_133418 [Xylaria bambusicola]
MALEAPLRSSTGSILSSFSAHSDMSVPSSNSPALQPPFRPMSSSSAESSGLRPSSAAAARSSPAPYLLSPSDIVGPSPVTSVGTDATEIEEEASDEARSLSSAAGSEAQPQLLKLRTNISDQFRQTANEEAVSVIHAPESFQSWAKSDTLSKQPESTQRRSPRQSPKLENLAISTPNDRASKTKSMGLPTPPPLSTDVKPVRYSIDSATPRAQNLQEVLSDSSRLRSSSASSLELIPEIKEPETDAEPDLEYDDDEEYSTPVRGEGQDDMEIQSLQSALKECWVLCNTLASLSTHHRERVFSVSGTPDGHEKAWKCCWKLCQRLYDNRNVTDEPLHVKADLDLCRDFCQALFDIRMRSDGMSDSILRVSFELNNHLYSAQDNRNLPEAFQERTLDFYITLCHRLMKQRGQLAEETNSLLRACWSLAEMLFSLRQKKRDGKEPDEELLTSAVQACWELCDIFREGWTQIRPDRGTPRPSQPNFFTFGREAEADGRASRQSNRSKRDGQKRDSTEKLRKPPPVPETPVTEFEDTPISPESSSPQAPNILVLGTESNRGGRWPSSASNLSGYSQSSQRTSSTATTATTTEDVNIYRIKGLVLKAAMNLGFSRDGPSEGHGSQVSLQTFVRSLPPGSFGSLPSHATLLQNYKNLVVSDSAFRQASALPSRGKRISATDMAKSVTFMTHRSSQYSFLRDLFKIVYGHHLEEIDSRKNFAIAV